MFACFGLKPRKRTVVEDPLNNNVPILQRSKSLGKGTFARREINGNILDPKAAAEEFYFRGPLPTSHGTPLPKRHPFKRNNSKKRLSDLDVLNNESALEPRKFRRVGATYAREKCYDDADI